MEYINDNYYHKYSIINFILDSNKEANNIFYCEKKILSNWLMSLQGRDFFNGLVLFNYNSFTGYFSLIEKELLQSAILEDNFEAFKKIVNDYENNYLTEERLAHSLWLSRLILNNDKYEWKYLCEARKRFIKEKNIINFKNKVKINNKIYDLNTILQAFVKNKNNFSTNTKEWLTKQYEKEIKIIKFYLEEKLTSEIADKSIS